MTPLKDLTGKRFGQFVVIERFHQNHRDGAPRWLCQCDCGKVVDVIGRNLANGGSTSCGHRGIGPKNSHWKGYGEVSGAYWSDIKSGARRRGLEFSITIEYAWYLFLLQNRRCALSDRPLVMKTTRETDGTASIDRMDSAHGYVAGNVQWTHKDVNRIKMDLPQDEFVKICREVAAHMTERA